MLARYYAQGERHGSTIAYYAQDQVGSVVATVDPQGQVTARLKYDSYGTITSSSGTLPDYRYAGLYAHPQSGLYLATYRAYDPKIGRWLSRDPIRELGGINLYGYVEGNPSSRIDPQGLCFEDACIGEGMALYGIVQAIVDAGTVGVGVWSVFNKPPGDAHDPNGAKAPGKPGEKEGFRDPKGGEHWAPNPNPGKGGSSHGWEDDKGRVWCPTGQGGRAHGGPHWDVQTPGGDNENVFPEEKQRE